MQDRIVRRVYLTFAAVCAVIAVAAFTALRNIGQAEATSDWVNHTHATIYEVDRILANTVAGAGAMHTYVWTGDPRELRAAKGEFSELDDHCEIAQALTRDETTVHAAVLELATLARQHAAANLALAEARQKKNRAELEALLAADPGAETLRQIKRLAAKIRAGQFELLNQRDQAAYRQAQTTRWVGGICVGLDLLLLAGVAWLIRDDLTARRRLTESLQAANATLETKVRERTRELAAENLERKWAAQSLEHQLRYNQIIVNSVSDLVFVVTKALTITRINPAVVRQTGWTEEAILGRPLSELVRLAEDPGSVAIIQALRSARELPDQPAQLADARGRSRAARFALLPLRDNDKVVGGVIILRVVES